MSDAVVRVKLPANAYPVYVKEGILDDLGILMEKHFSSVGPCLLVTDTRVERLYGARCCAALESRGWRVVQRVVRPGERAKSLAGVSRLYDAAVAAGFDRETPVVALGGGVVGDLAGFAAATYLRGVPLVAVPTTLLAQVDSSVGGKTAVNHPRGKNLIGAFHQPRLVLADPLVLATLPERQFWAGLPEVLKYGLIRDAGFCNWIEAHWAELVRREPVVLAEAVRRAVAHKAAVVEEDEREADRRRLLNFGHTLGHALEAAGGYRHYLHGEAVQIGMVAAVELSLRLGLLDATGTAAARQFLERIPLRRPPAELSAAAVTARLDHDKKRRGLHLVMVLLAAPGRAVLREVAMRGPDSSLDPVPALLDELIGLYLAGRPPF